VEMAWRSQQLAAALGFPFVDLPEQVARSVKTVLQFMVDHLTVSGGLDPGLAEGVVRRLLWREDQGPTALGNGVGLPHAINSYIRQEIGLVGYSPGGVRWGTSDGPRVHTVCLTLFPNRPSLGSYNVISSAIRSLWTEGCPG
jgi:mannitol/fructose-specific phosphotransferase system IIA component (Ntr-type)